MGARHDSTKEWQCNFHCLHRHEYGAGTKVKDPGPEGNLRSGFHMRGGTGRENLQTSAKQCRFTSISGMCHSVTAVLWTFLPCAGANYSHQTDFQIVREMLGRMKRSEGYDWRLANTAEQGRGGRASECSRPDGQSMRAPLSTRTWVF
eukprot:scaffold296107_cov15-Tisochrysis_lutea.AAC.1